ncbi:MAG: alpha/beta hydrolase [Oscillospiraceae bacterium]
MSINQNNKDRLKMLAIVGGIFSTSFVITGELFHKFSLSKTGIQSNFVKKLLANLKEKAPIDDYKKRLDKVILDGANWFHKVNPLKVTAETQDKRILHADVIMSKKLSDVWVICIHGYGSSPQFMGVYADGFHKMGYNVLLPSLRGHADSDEELISMGWNDRLDVLVWINQIAEKHPNSKIILHGVSMGGATAMMVTGEELPKNVKLAIEDCGYTTVWDILAYKIKQSFKLPLFPLLYSADAVNRHKEKFGFKEASAINQVKKSHTPTLFIHGEKDDFVPYSMLDEVYNAAACVKEKLSIPDAPHARSVCAHPRLYWNGVKKFIAEYL